MDSLFYKEDLLNSSEIIFLDEGTSKHIIQVLRMKTGEKIRLTNGKGLHVIAEIFDDNRKKAGVKILDSEQAIRPSKNISIAISPVKNTSRFEWFLEKATEIGVSEIIPLLCDRTEKLNLKTARLDGILISAMLQSGQYWKPVLADPLKFSQVVDRDFQGQKFIAHCENDRDRFQLTEIMEKESSKQILIGPEGDFSAAEINLALENNFSPVLLGLTRLRTETAGIVAATLLASR